MNWKILSAKQFSEYAREWDELNRATINVAFFDSEFVTSLLKHYSLGNEYCVLAYEGEKLVAAGVFKLNGMGQWATFMPSQCPLGLWLCYKNELNSDELNQLATALPGSVITLDFLQIDSKFMNFLPEEDFKFQPYIVTASRSVPSDFDEYFQALGKNLRQNYNKVINRAARNNEKLQARFVSSAEEVAKAIITYGEIESTGWKNEHGTAISPTNTQGEFYIEVLSRLAAKGQALCWYYLINDVVVAVDLCILQSKTLIILKTTYNEAFSKQSPALQLKIEMLKYYAQHQNEVRNIEFYGKAMDWHKRLNSDLREIQHVTWYRNNWVKMGIELVKSLKRRIKPI